MNKKFEQRDAQTVIETQETVMELLAGGGGGGLWGPRVFLEHVATHEIICRENISGLISTKIYFEVMK